MRPIKLAGWSMIWVGSLILLFLGYQLVFTNVLNSRAQNAAETALESRFETVRIEQPSKIVLPPLVATGQTTATSVVEVEPISYFPETSPELGAELGRITIEAIEVDKVIVEGVERDELKAGPGHMPWTPLPCQPGNAVISGHRTTYGAPFFRLDELEPGDEIVIETVVGTHVFEVREIFIVQPTDVWVTDERVRAWLTLTTCNPRYSARQRLIIVAELVEGPNLEYAQALVDGLVEEVSA